MNFWIDAQISPAFAPWLSSYFGVVAYALRDLGLRDAMDHEIFNAARSANAVIVLITKDRDFSEMVVRHGSPPQVLWVTCGNTSNARLRSIFTELFPQALALLQSGEPMVEITDRI
ncbi:hypothetical protein OSCT_2077 [Oscillochloris trichoides DG-6]|uniref:DUF5615 domain-containing protein n=1 Tax=Oscillochloris trichoides DG-6 TaxID=765420 RepID=E1IFH6_9CHLR|nr:DUF5615 family PIN-like protein [Oscillochloris trichoides]EFO80086.1 hypothetical protein OSCT_2077 [Oscillochloris trichoides DG-6]